MTKQADVIAGLEALLAQASGKKTRYVRHEGQMTYQERIAKGQKQMQREAGLSQAMQSPQGLAKIASNMANPVRMRLDYKGLFRKFALVEQIPDGVPIVYDKDIPQAPAVKVGEFGAPPIVEMEGQRVELTPFEIGVKANVPYSELGNRRFRILDRAKDRYMMAA